MLNNKKIRIMSKLAIYEQNEGKDDIKLSKYYRLDYIRLHLLQDILSVTIAYILVAGMIIFYHMENLIENAFKMNYKELGMRALGIYLIVVFLYGICSVMASTIKYNRSRKKLLRYFKSLNTLREVYREEESGNR